MYVEWWFDYVGGYVGVELGYCGIGFVCCGGGD